MLHSVNVRQVAVARRCMATSPRSSMIRVLSTLGNGQQQQQQQQSNHNIHQYPFLWAGGSALAMGTFAAATNHYYNNSTQCEQSTNKTVDVKIHHNLASSNAAKHDFAQVQASHDISTLPVYTSADVAAHNGSDGTVWMSYGGVVYDVTDFIVNHPGGSEKILTAAGSAIEPYWHLYRQHFASDLPMRLMEEMAIGKLAESDQDAIDEQMEEIEKTDPYAKEPLRHRALIVHSDTPMNAEVPARLLTENYLTPNALFYIRHHHPVPFLTETDLQNFRLTIDLSAVVSNRDASKITIGTPTKQFTLDDIKAMPATEITVTLQCSGNRRGGYNDFSRTSGTAWDQGAISNAKFKGVRLSHLLKEAGLDCSDPLKVQEDYNLQHVRFHALDGMMASIGFEKAVNPFGDCLVAYEMNGEPLPRDHGFPLRIIVPGYAAVRNVKWVNRIELSENEAEGPWQRGLNYKTLPPNVTDAKDIDLEQMPSMTEVSLFSGITKMHPVDGDNDSKPTKSGENITYNVQGWAWSGGGRNIVRVDVTGDGGKTWTTAKLKEGAQQKFGRAWAWTFWECEVPALVRDDGTVEVASKAVDMAFNVQPEKSDHSWNVRGLGNNSWYRVQRKVID